MSGTLKCSALALDTCVDLPVKAASYSWDGSRELGPVGLGSTFFCSMSIFRTKMHYTLFSVPCDHA